ncbi:hypothetical protein L596_026656 [Steinernema carpocapsae]|uniref:Uncharacterized protein n=1 Tax=Steinernema carpocapsae TaxID=34508 RepID=A0A4U5M211_STECR|nr:hypothetical protein L596_026656 [Steinernema carpocapsae]
MTLAVVGGPVCTFGILVNHWNLELRRKPFSKSSLRNAKKDLNIIIYAGIRFHVDRSLRVAFHNINLREFV